MPSMEHFSMSQKNLEKLSPLPTETETATFIAAGYSVDREGRPLHPHLCEQGVAPLPNGKGAYWNWGPNFTTDPIVLTNEDRPRVLLIHRSDTGDLALPGGFVDAEELQNPIQAAYRELKEETNLELDSQGTLIYQGIVDDPRATANAWPETSAYLFTVSEPLPVQAGDDAREAGWYYIDTLPDTLYGSHANLIQKALETQTPLQRTVEEILAIPVEEREIHHIDAGHMAYQHFFTRHQDDHLFVKAHDSSRFTDSLREAHSRAYLQKEHGIYTHLKQQSYVFLPDRIALIDDTVLAMDALHAENGWAWRAPNETELFNQYVSDTIKAFDALQNLNAPAQPEYHSSIQDTYSTLWQEGWDAITDENMDKIVNKIRHFSSAWDAEHTQTSEVFIARLPLMKEKSLTIDRHQELFMAHNDARQSNIAWHPQYGTKLVDWSWGDIAPRNADSTMFLIDLLKSGKNVTNYLPAFNQDHAHTLVGFWLAHSLWETRDDSQTVREHQVASAMAAFQLLNLGQE